MGIVCEASHGNVLATEFVVMGAEVEVERMPIIYAFMASPPSHQQRTMIYDRALQLCTPNQ